MLEKVVESKPDYLVDSNPPFIVPIREGEEFRGEIFLEDPEFWQAYLIGATGVITFVEEGEGGHSFSRALEIKWNPFRFYWNVPLSFPYFSGNVRITAIEWDTQAGHYPIYVG